LAQIDQALDRLAEAAPPIKRQLINAMAHTVAADQVIKAREGELLRAIADALGCPLPPFVNVKTG
jgi:uncharacterized tellurite resistance protein B-like protein